jgi:hypothetical protein
MPTTSIATFGAQRLIPLIEPDDAPRIDVNLATGTYALGTVLGEVTATPGTYKTYATGNVDGSQLATGLLEYACVVDASGNITLGNSASGGGEFAQTQKGVPMFISGTFNCADLVGLDAGAVTKLGRLLQGTITAGKFSMYGA